MSSPPELKRKAKDIRQSLVTQVLGNPPGLPDVPAIRKFLATHSSLQQKLETTRQRISEVSNAKAEYEPLEQKLKLRQQETHESGIGFVVPVSRSWKGSIRCFSLRSCQ